MTWLMETKVHCPGCGAALRVPSDASGQHARCPACAAVFVVPGPDDLVEETIASWIEQDVEELQRQHELDLARMQQMWQAEMQQTAPPPRDMNRRTTGTRSDPHLAKPAAQARAASPQRDTTPTPTKPVPVTPAARSPAPPAAAPAAPVAIDFSEQDTPRLHVVEVTALGVSVAFDSRWLEHEGFRLSMPVRCVFSGETDRSKLLARPLAFADQSGAVFRSPRELECGHEQRLLAGQQPHDLLRSMGLIRNVPPPFNLPLPYYVAQTQLDHSLHCSTRSREAGGMTCFVGVPDGRYALEWVARVNGVCGPDYERLEQQVAMLQDDAWRELPQAIKQRISVWCTFSPGERFALYINDADFGKSDAGLAGIVVTNQRLVYHKYHHQGSAPLDMPTTLWVRGESNFLGLTIDDGVHRHKAGLIHPQDLQTLVNTLAKSRWKVVEEK